MSKYKYEKEFLFFQRTPDQAIRFLKDSSNLDLTQVVDDKLNNCLHQCAFQGSLELMKVYINHQRKFFAKNPLVATYNLKRKFEEKEEFKASEQQIIFRLKEWVNSENRQGFTPSHYAAFKGFIDILDELAGLGADHTIKTKSGLGILHLAAQGDQVKAFIYFRQKIPIDDLDGRDSTPLHWAAFSGSEKVTEYLLAERAHKQQKKTQKQSKKRKRKSKKNPIQELDTDWINAQDVQKQTALHLATANGNTKIVRRLLIAGANRHIQNKQRKQPLEIAQQNQFLNIEQFLNDKYTWADYIKFFMNIKIKYEPRKKSLAMPIIFLILAILIIGTIDFSLKFEQDFVFWIQNGVFAGLILLYASLIFHSPKMQRGSYKSLLKKWLSKQAKPMESSFSQSDDTVINSSIIRSSSSNILKEICFRCIQYKPKRSYHCDVCNTCIRQYDHHCPWINNCVGKHNFGRFIMFIILLFLTLNWIFIISIHFILKLVHDDNDKLGFFNIREEILELQGIMYIFVIVTTLLFAIFTLPLALLIGVHLRNLYYGKTTYERFSKANQSVLIKSEQGLSELSTPRVGKKKRGGCLEMCLPGKNERERLINTLDEG